MSSEAGTSNVRASIDGFTLIELLIVVVIIGILAAIAIPQFTGTKEQAVVAKMKADLHNIATAQEVYYADSSTYATSVGALSGINLSTDVTANSFDGGDDWWAAQLSASGTSTLCEMSVGDNATEPTGGPTSAAADSLGRVVCAE